MESVLLLNQDFSYLSTVSWKRAVNLVLKRKAEVVKYTEKVVTNAERTIVIKIPKVLKLVYFIAKIHKVRMVYNRKVVYARDGHVCAYCGSSEKLTIDHIIPKARGGKTCYENVVSCCFRCNNLKNDRTPEEARMKLHKKPYAPTVPDYMRIKFKELGLDLDL